MNSILKISYIKIDVTMRTSDKAELPEWMGSAIRGAIGTELLSQLCTAGNNEYRCHECNEKCSAGILFAVGSSDQSDSRVSPYIISSDENSFDGEIIRFSITLFSEGTETVKDVMQVLKNGLRLGAGRAVFVLDSVTDAVTGEKLYDGLYLVMPEVHIFTPEYENVSKLYVEYLTPYRTKVSASGFGFEQLVRAMLRRISTLLRQNGTEPEFDYQLLIEKASKVNLKYKNLDLVKTQRYSSRTDSKMDVTGFKGMMVFEGDITPFMPLVRITEIIHAGKMCVMGLGEIKAYVLEQ